MRDHPDAGPGRAAPAGIFYALAAFGSWGLVVPLHFKLLAAVPAPAILAHRIVWGSLLAVVLVWSLGRRAQLLEVVRNRRRLGLLCLSAVLVGVNWLVYIWAVNTGHLVQTSLGYFINPLVNVILGVLVLGERLRTVQVAACGVAAAGVLVLVVAGGRVPWIALTLASSFGLYGLIRKIVPVDALVGFCVEALVLLAPALAALVALEVAGPGTVPAGGLGTGLLLVLTGATTAFPLIWFAEAARRLRLSTLGLLQYLAPSCTLLLGTLLFGEPFTGADAVAFAAIWAALALYSADALGLVGSGGREAKP